MKGVDEADLFAAGLRKAGVEIQDRSENGHGHSGDDDGGFGGTQPYDEKRGQGRFRKAVQDHEVGLQHLKNAVREPKQKGDGETDDDHEGEAYQSLREGDAHMKKEAAVPPHGEKKSAKS